MKSPRRTPWGIESALDFIAALPEDQKVDALLHLLQNILSGLPAATLRRKRERFVAQFAQCGCSYEVCTAVQELVDLHLAHQAKREPEGSRSHGSARGKSRPLPPRF
jgi:hypothetical protein